MTLNRSPANKVKFESLVVDSGVKPGTVGFYLLAYRQAHQLTQKQLADLCDVPQERICMYEQNLTGPSCYNLKKLCIAMNISADTLLGIELK